MFDHILFCCHIRVLLKNISSTFLNCQNYIEVKCLISGYGFTEIKTLKCVNELADAYPLPPCVLQWYDTH